MGKEVKVIVKDISKLEFELLEDANKGDYINLNTINNSIDLSEIRNILETQKEKYYRPFKQQEKEQIEKEAINSFLASDKYVNLNNELNQYKLRNVELKKELDSKIDKYKQSDEFKNIQNKETKYKEEIAKLSQQLQSNYENDVNKYKQSNEYISLLEKIEQAKKTEALLRKDIENAVDKYKVSDEYINLNDKLNRLEKDKLTLQEQLKSSEQNSIIEYKKSPEYLNLLKENRSVNELKIKYQEEINNSILKFKNSPEYLNLKNKEKELDETRIQLQNTKEKHKLELENQLLEKKDDIIKEYKESEDYKKLINTNDELQKEINRLTYNQRTKNTKLIGEQLEKWILNKYNDTFGTAFSDDSLLEKANTVIDNTKPDFLFQVFNPNLTNKDPSYITGTVVIEAKTELDDSQFHKKNSDHFKKLDSDRKKNKGDYAVLVTTLEPDNDFSIYLAPGYENMFVVRPEWLMSLLSLIRRIFLKQQEIKQLDIQFKTKEEIKKMFDDFRNNLLENSFKNMTSKLENIQKSADIIIKNAKSILDDKETIVSTHMNTIKNKIEGFKLERKLEKLEKIEKFEENHKKDLFNENNILENDIEIKK